jgi:hypothetical protein
MKPSIRIALSQTRPQNAEKSRGDPIKMSVRVIVAVCANLVALSVGAPLYAQDAPYSPAVAQDHPQHLLWGDTHVHTNNSPDAFTFGNVNLTAIDAYRFAKGEELQAHNGMAVRIRQPLDFLVVADHAEFLGVFPRLVKQDKQLLASSLGARWGGYLANGEVGRMMLEFVDSLQSSDEKYFLPTEIRHDIWRDVTTLADEQNQPGKFTTFTAFEWTSQHKDNNLHRVVIFRDQVDKTSQVYPFSAKDSDDPEDLWAYLANYESATGGEVIAIAHNGNISNGLMFSDKTLAGEPLDRAYAETRARWEPLYEVTQVKGDGEAHPYLSPNDEFADYENWDEDNIGRTVKKEDWMLKHEYARSALQLGLQFEDSLGVNPFKVGLIGSTDSHTAFATADEDNFFGKFPDSQPSVERTKSTMGGVLWPNWRLAASGYAGIWAHKNTRASIFAAMKRRETYATTGPRIHVRFFGGWSFDQDAHERPDYVAYGYKNGVPMGGDLTNAPNDSSPQFIVVAAKDPDGANLDRVQIIKGWIDESGARQEKVYDVALSDGRAVDPKNGRAPPVGSTVNIAEATYDNSIGAAHLSTVWTDPSFEPDQRAFYYVRALEIPTPRWSTYDAKYFGIDLDAEIPRTTQERIYTSAIWYTP